MRTNTDLKSGWKKLKKDFNPNYFICLCFWLLACLFFSKPINQLLGKLGGFLFLADNTTPKSNEWLLIILLILIYVVRFYYRKRITGFSLRNLYLITPLVLWALLNLTFGLNPPIKFTESTILSQIPQISILLVIWIIELLILILNYFREDKLPRKNESSFITDIAFDPKDKDEDQKEKLGFETFATRIVNEIKTVSSKESVVFGINGEWGEGKTSMINLIRKQLEDEQYTVMDLHPWKTNSGKAMNQLFFDALKDGLKNKIWGINWKIDRYADALLQLDKTGISKTIWQMFFQPDSVEKQKEKLAESMKLLDKNLVVVVDDLDRLAKNEIANVLKLMRDTANFPNLVFLAAYHRAYLDEAIKSKINPHNYKNYLDKIVLWEAPIYRPQPRKYLEVLKNLLKKKLPQFEQNIDEIFGIEQEQTLKIIHTSTRRELKEKNGIKMFDTPYDIHSKIFTDLRKTKRFINALTFDIKIVQDKIEFHDFYYLALLKFCNTQYYNAFKKCFHYLYGVENNSHILGIIDREEKHYREQFAIEFSISEDAIELLPFAIVKELLSQSTHYLTSTIYFYKNFPIYFHLGNSNDITMFDFTEMLNAKDFDAFKHRVDELLKIGNIIEQFDINSIITALRDRFNFGDTNAYIEYFKSMIWMAIKYDHSDFYKICHDRMKQICLNKEYGINIQQVQTELKKFILQEQIQSDFQYFIYLLETTSSYILNSDTFEIAKENFNSYVSSGKDISPELINLFYCSSKSADKNGSMVEDAETILRMKQKATEQPNKFIELIVVRDGNIKHSSDPDNYHYRFVSFLLKIFTSYNEFISFLKKTDFGNENDRAKLYLKYIDQAFPDKNITIPYTFLPENNDYENLFAGLDTLDVLLDWKLRARIDEGVRKIKDKKLND